MKYEPSEYKPIILDRSEFREVLDAADRDVLLKPYTYYIGESNCDTDCLVLPFGPLKTSGNQLIN